MHALVGLIIAALGAVAALFFPKVSGATGRHFRRSNHLAFRALGGVLVVLGLLYAVGVVGASE